MDKDNQQITIKWLLSPVLEKAVIRPLIKSSKLHRELKTYQPISNLSFISKSIEKVALLQLSTFFEDQNLLAYLPQCLPQTPLNRNSCIKHMWWNPGKCCTEQINSHGMPQPQCSIWHCQSLNIENCHETLFWPERYSSSMATFLHL